MLTLMSLRISISLQAFTVYMETHCGLKFHFGQNGQSEILMRVKFNLPEFMWTLPKNWQLQPKWNFKPVWGHFEFQVNVLQD